MKRLFSYPFSKNGLVQFFLTSSFWTLLIFPLAIMANENIVFFSETSGANGGFASTLLELFKTSLRNGDSVLPVLMALFAGFLTSLSPCVYPLIPITLSIMGARKYDSHLQGFIIALSYVIGMATLYSALGVIFSSVGMILGSAMQHPIILLSIAMFFALMALSMLGAFNLVLPESMMNRLSHVGGQGPKGAFLMGLVAGLIATPCTGPILGFILTLIAAEKNILLGILLMLTFSLGMGIPFLILGTFSSALSHIPKSGTWMNNIKHVFGAAILGAAVYYASLVISSLKDVMIFMGGSKTSIILLFGILGVLFLLVNPKSFSHLFIKRAQIVVGAASMSLFVALLLAKNSLEVNDSKATEDGFDWHVIDANTKDENRLAALLKQAHKDNKTTMLDFYADWCVACLQFEKLTFKEKQVANKLRDLFLIRIDSTTTSDYLNRITNRFMVTGLPTLVFINQNGEEVDGTRVLGYMQPKEFLTILHRANP